MGSGLGLGKLMRRGTGLSSSGGSPSAAAVLFDHDPLRLGLGGALLFIRSSKRIAYFGLHCVNRNVELALFPAQQGQSFVAIVTWNWTI
jgi:hypothetical protein